MEIGSEQKVNEIPYDFVRKRLSVVTSNEHGELTLITKGALEKILSVSTSLQGEDETSPLDASGWQRLNKNTASGAKKVFVCSAWQRRCKRAETYSTRR